YVDDRVALVHTHDAHALRGAADDTDLVHALAVHDAVARDHHQLVTRIHGLDRDDLARRVVDAEVDHALPAARLQAVLLDVRALAAPVLRDDKQRRPLRAVRPAHDHADHDVVTAQADTAHAGCHAAHLTDVALVEADRHAVARRENDVVGAGRDLHVNQLVAFLD